MCFLRSLFLTLVIIILSCDLFLPDERSDSVKIYPLISFSQGGTYYLDSVQLIKIDITINGKTLKNTFAFKDGEGFVDYIPINTSFKITVFGCDSDTNVLFKGEIERNGITDDAEISIEADEVTPLKPSDLTLKILTDETLQFSWTDRSRNEEGFYLITREIEYPHKYIRTLKIDNKNVTSYKIAKDPTDSFLYCIEAYNSEGSSEIDTLDVYHNTVDWFHDDIVKEIDEPVLQPGTDVEYIVGRQYLFQTKKETCSRDHPLQYKFDLDDKETDWLNEPSCIHSWKTSGKKVIRVKKRCSQNTYVESEWSPSLVIEVKEK